MHVLSRQTCPRLLVPPGPSLGHAVVFGPGRNPINFVSAHDVAAIVDLAVHDTSLHAQILAATGPENLTFTQITDRSRGSSGSPGSRSPEAAWTDSVLDRLDRTPTCATQPRLG